MRASGMRPVACAWGRARTRSLACRHTLHPRKSPRLLPRELIMHSLFYQYPEYRVRHVSRGGLEGRRSQPLRSSASWWYPLLPPPFATAIPRLTDWRARRRRRRRRETCKRVETNLWPRHITRALDGELVSKLPDYVTTAGINIWLAIRAADSTRKKNDFVLTLFPWLFCEIFKAASRRRTLIDVYFIQTLKKA